MIKWWLLAIPHYLVVGLFMGGTWFAFNGRHWEGSGFGLIGLLALVAGVVLAFTGRYPTPLFDLLLGLNRWVIRVAAYAGLMTDTYPPFRLDTGGNEPGAITMPPSNPDPPAGAGATGSERAAGGWTVGPIVAVSVGCLTALTSLGMLAGGGVALWAGTIQRDAGFVTSPAVELDTEAYAVVTEGFEIHAEGPDWVLPHSILGAARVRVTGNNGSIFLGIARTEDVERYLDGVSRAVVPDLTERDGHNLPALTGSAPRARPGDEDFWIASSDGTGTRSIRWALSNGAWTIVVMNPDASKGLAFEGDVGAEIPVLLPIAIALLIGSGALLLIAIALIGGGIARAGRPRGERTTA